MRRIICTILAFLIALCICGCNKPSDTGMKKKDNIDNSQSNTDSQNNDENDTVKFNDIRTLDIPDVIGLQLQEARDILNSFNIEIKTEPVYKARIKKHQEYILADIGIVTEVEKDYDNNCIILYYQEKGNRFDYIENADGTVTLGAATSYNPSEDFIIPAFYKNKRVSAISPNGVGFINRISSEFDIPTIKVPEGVTFQAEITCDNIVYYNPNEAL